MSATTTANRPLPKKINKRFVDSIKPGDLDQYFWDKELRGFGIRIKPSGLKTYIIQYRNAQGQSKRLTLGTHGKLATEKARSLAKTQLGDVEQGSDPAEERKRELGGRQDTFEALAEKFIERYAKPKNRSWRETKRILDREVTPSWGNRPCASITRRDVNDLLDGIVDRGSPYTANRTLSVVRKLFNWAVDRGDIEINPVARISKPGKEITRDRVLSDDEVRTLWQAWDQLSWPFGPLFKLMLITGQRRGEVAGMRWADLDIENTLWNIPREQTKSDRAHEVPLNKLAIEIIGELPRMGDLVFPDRRTGTNPVSGFSKAKRNTDQLVNGAVTGWRLHDLRRTVGTNLARLGFHTDLIGRLLNHAPSHGVTGVYDRHSYLPEKRRALDAWVSKLNSIISDTPDNVVELHRGPQ